MTSSYVTDAGGKRISVVELNGRNYPPFEVQCIKQATDIEARPDDLLIITYPKAGTHWVFEITRLLLAGTLDGPLVEKDTFMLEERKKIPFLPSPRNINTHFSADALSPDFFKQKVKMIYMTRDPRDILVSYYHQHKKDRSYGYDGEFNDFFPLFLGSELDYGSWFDHTKSWEKAIKENPENPILVLQFEAMKKNPLENIKKLSEFLGFDYSEDFLQKIGKKTDIKNMKKERQIQENDKDTAMYRKGVVGDWKNDFTEAQTEQFNEVFEREMVGTDAYKLYSHTMQE